MSTPHKRIIPGTQGACPANVTAFTDPVIVVDVTLVRKTHIDELRAAVGAEQTRRYSAVTPWTDPTIVAKVTLPRVPHIEELRAAIYLIRNPLAYQPHSCPANQDTCVCEAHTFLFETGKASNVNCPFCQDYCKANVQGYCPTDLSLDTAWIDEPVIAQDTFVRKPHMDQLRTAINGQSIQCVCEAERCNYCADCGHSYKSWYSACTHAGCACNDHKYAECSHSTYWTYNWVNICSVVDDNSPDFVTALGNKLPPGINDATQVPWNCMCGFTPPGLSWSNHKGHATWGCMCNPFQWSGG